MQVRPLCWKHLPVKSYNGKVQENAQQKIRKVIEIGIFGGGEPIGIESMHPKQAHRCNDCEVHRQHRETTKLTAEDDYEGHKDTKNRVVNPQDHICGREHGILLYIHYHRVRAGNPTDKGGCRTSTQTQAAFHPGAAVRAAARLRCSELPLEMVYAIINGMNITIDKAGRVVLPKRVRDRFRLRAGANLELEEHPEGLILRPVARRASMAQEKGIWVHLGKIPEGLDWDELGDAVREERMRDATGL